MDSTFGTAIQFFLALLLQFLLPALALAVALTLMLLLIAYLGRIIHSAVQSLFSLMRRLWADVAKALADRAIPRVSAGLAVLAYHVRLENKYPFPVMLAAAIFVSPILVAIMVIEVDYLSQYFDSITSQVVLELPFLSVTTGLLLALLFVGVALLLGYGLEALLGLVPHPMATITGRWRKRVVPVVATVAVVGLWLLLMATVMDIRIEMYRALGDSICEVKAADAATAAAQRTPAPEDDFTGADAAAAPPQGSDAQAVAAAVMETCRADWNANHRAMWVQVAMAELALCINGAFATFLFTSLYLLGIILLTAVSALLFVGTGLIYVLRHVTVALQVVIVHLLRILRRMGGWTASLLRRLGVPLPPPDDGEDEAQDGSMLPLDNRPINTPPLLAPLARNA